MDKDIKKIAKDFHNSMQELSDKHDTTISVKTNDGQWQTISEPKNKQSLKTRTMETKPYRPAHIDFDVAADNNPIPERLGEFEQSEDAEVFMAKNFVTTNNAVTVNRFMDNFEKSELRKKYNDILENLLPVLEQKFRDAMAAFLDAKKEKEDAFEMVSAYTNEAKMTAIEVKRGLVEIKLDEQFTWKLPYKSRFYWFTYIDKEIRLVKITDMTENEKGELFSQGKVNEEVFENGEVKIEAGEKKQLPKKSK